MGKAQNSLVYSKNSVEFVTVANEYCKFIEASEGLSQHTFVKLALRLLPLLYLKASLLEETIGDELITNNEDDFGTETFVTEVEYYAIENSVKTKLSDYNEYPELFDTQSSSTNETTLCFISEDLADIYQDLKNFTQNYRNGIDEVMHDAILEAAENFKIYWGQKLVNVSRALHSIFYNGDLSQEIEEGIEDEIDEDEEDDARRAKASGWLKDRFADKNDDPFAI